MKKKIVFSVLLGAFIILCFYSFVICFKDFIHRIDWLKSYPNNMEYSAFRASAINFAIFTFCHFATVILSCYLIFKIWFKGIDTIKYSYQDYKAERTNRIERKKEIKKNKLQNKIDKLDK